MRQHIVAGNWKMNTSLEEGLALARDINARVTTHETLKARVILGVPFIHLTQVVELVDPNRIMVSAQNCSAWEAGAYTGEVSAKMIRSGGAKCVIIGHSERRKYFSENSDVLKLKVNLALLNQLKPIFCFGELLEERNNNSHFDVVKNQIKDGLFHLEADRFREVILAYEPVWAIGTGVNATAGQAQEMHQFIRRQIEEKYGLQVADDTTILYGGSCNPTNAGDLFKNPDVDGGLIGGASLKADDFMAIVDAI